MMQTLGPFAAFLPLIENPSEKKLHWCYIVIDNNDLSWSIQTAPINDNEELLEHDALGVTTRTSDLVQKILIMQTNTIPNNNFCFLLSISQEGTKRLETFENQKPNSPSSQSGVVFEENDFVLPPEIECQRVAVERKYEAWRTKKKALLTENAINICLKLQDPTVNVWITPESVEALLKAKESKEYLSFAQIYYAGNLDAFEYDLTKLIKELTIHHLIFDTNTVNLDDLWSNVQFAEDVDLITSQLETKEVDVNAFYQRIPDEKYKSIVLDCDLQKQLEYAMNFADKYQLDKPRLETLIASFSDKEIKDWISHEKDLECLLSRIDGAQKNRCLALALPQLDMDLLQFVNFCRHNTLTLTHIEALKQLDISKIRDLDSLGVGLLDCSSELFKNITTITSVKKCLDETIHSLAKLTQLLRLLEAPLREALIEVIGVDKIKIWIIDESDWISIKELLIPAQIEQYFQDVSTEFDMNDERSDLSSVPLEKKINNGKVTTYKQYDFTKDKTYAKSSSKSIELYQELLNNYDKTLSLSKKKCADAKITVPYQYLMIAEDILKQVKALAATSQGKEAVYLQLNQALYRCNLALESPKNRKNIHQLTLLAKELPGHPSGLSQALGVLLYLFAALILVAGVLAFIPTQSGNVLLNVFVGIKLYSMASVIANVSSSAAVAIGGGMTANAVAGSGGVALSAAIGLGSFYAGLFKQKGLAKSVTELGKQFEIEKPTP